MNFAFVTVLLLLLSLPGIAARRGYYAGRFSITGISTNVLNEIAWSLIPAVFFNAIAILLLESFSSFIFKFEFLGYLLTGGNDGKEINQIFDNIHDNIFFISLYLLLISIAGFLIGIASRNAVRRWGWDIKFLFLKFPNDWHYLFTGEYLDFENGIGAHKNIDFILVDVMTQIGNKNIIYSGILEDYFLSKTDGGLNRIIIKYPTRTALDIFGNLDDPVEIPGNYLTIPYSKIANINVQYFEMEENETK